MVVMIDDPVLERWTRQQAEQSGRSVEQVVADVIRASIDPDPHPRPPLTESQIQEKLRLLKEITAGIASLPAVDHRSDEEIVGYDQNGLPA